jgi:tRNA dimethylallyltransferase
MKEKFLVSIVGATGIGKTSLAIELASYFQTEIISCDSRQFYKEMNIGTAVPLKEELQKVKHHFIQDRSIFDDYSVGDFERDAILKLIDLFREFNVVIMVGGSGLYVNAVLEGLDNFPEIDQTIRITLKKELHENGIELLQNRLKRLDPITFKKIDLLNKQRLIRALEICIGTGLPYSSFLKNKKNKREFNPITIGITAEREIIYKRINERVDQMMESGLLEEALTLFSNRDLNALQTVGYKELFQYINKEISLDFAISEIKKNTRRFAKRQGTWFKKDKDIKWFDYHENIDLLTKYIESKIKNKRQIVRKK